MGEGMLCSWEGKWQEHKTTVIIIQSWNETRTTDRYQYGRLRNMYLIYVQQAPPKFGLF
jgi:hypothetical protein